MDPNMDGPPGTPTNKNEPVNKRASPQTKLFQGVRKLKADWPSNMPLSLGGGRSTSMAENTITDSTVVDEKKQTERVHKEQEKEKDKGAGKGIASMNREELMGFCIKLIKRQKLLEERQSQSLEMYKFVADERAELLLLAKDMVGLPPSTPETGVPSLRAAWLRNKEGAVRSDGQNADNNGNEYAAIDTHVSRTPPPSQLEEELKMLKEMLALRSTAYSELEEEHKTVKRELVSRASLSQLKEELTMLKQELASRTSAYSELEEEHKAVKHELASRTSPSQFQEEISMLKNELASRATAYSELEEDISTLKNELVSRTTAYSELEEENKAVKHELASRASSSQFEEEISTLKNKLASRTTAYSELEEDVSTLKSELASRTTAYSEIEEKHKAMKHELASRASPSQFEEEISALKNELASRTTAHSELEEDISTLKSELASRTTAYSELEEENKAVKHELVSRASSSQFEEEISALKNELASRTTAYSELEEDITTLKRELASRTTAYSELEEEHKAVKHELASRTSAHSKLEEESKTLKQDLEQSRGMYMETISAAEANASKANEDIKKRLEIQEQYEERISCLQEQVRTTEKNLDQALEEAQVAKTSRESALADLEASRIANAEVENKEILELRENVRTGQEETARLTALLDDEESKISDIKRVLEVKSDELAHSEALVQRLRTEMKSEKQRHAERIAALSTHLAETEKLKESAEKLRIAEAEKARESSQKLRESSKVTDARLKASMARVEQAEALAAALTSELEATKKKAEQDASDTQQCADLHAELEALKASSAADIASLTREAMKKSKIARSLLDEKDKKLEAAKEIMDELKNELAQATSSEHSGQSPLNVEYLRNVMLRYMSFGASSAERKQLLPVICTLLDFSEGDVRKLMNGLNWEWWGGTEFMKSTKNITPTLSSPRNERRGSLGQSSDRGPLLGRRSTNIG